MNEQPKLDALIFAPHPDDAEIGMGGTIAKMIDAGQRVGIVDMTRGEAGTKGTAETRALEARNASEILGIHFRENLDLGDGRIANTDENRLKVVEIIRRCRSSHIFINTPHDRHPDHIAGARLVADAFFLARLPKVETASPAFSARWCFYYFIHDHRRVTFAVDVTPFYSKKIETMKAYRSQFVDVQLPDHYRYIGMQDYLSQMEAYNRSVGTLIGCRFAEGFHCDSPIAIPLPTWIES
ncbi:MAG: bacillithiol biosynthesis deacetylase BshB1 [Candidatus Omnitrophota bacterium]|jgi:bacillithiol biosynthesis deacetylase BshB1|nr:MAG: bacillithiol biosynthesis deacetylase BshB1 [Candidatus Omnitrophota bacterium]